VLESYEHHVFLSYPRTGDVPDWVRNHLYPVLMRQLESEMSEDPRVFVDETIDTGSVWSDALYRALHRSCCLLAVWTPQFFRSKWCIAEWQTMLRREERLKLGTRENPIGLVYPVVFADGESFPDEARRRQAKLDMRDYAYPYPQFKTTVKYLEFHDKVGVVARELVAMLNRTPTWDPAWESVRPEPAPPDVGSFKRL